MLSPDLSAYWDKQAARRIDNIWKRQEITKRLLALDLIGKTIIEIGCGLGTAFGAISVVLGRNFNYLATDVSPEFIKVVWEYWKLKAIQADVTQIRAEDGLFDLCVALDTLEHVPYEERQAGYREISRILKPTAKVVLNIPLGKSLHDPKYDFDFGIKDVGELIDICGMELILWEKYSIHCNNHWRSYVWVIAERNE